MLEELAEGKFSSVVPANERTWRTVRSWRVSVLAIRIAYNEDGVLSAG